MSKIYNSEEAIKIYQEILDGKRNSFPPMFKDNLVLLRDISRFLFEEILNYDLKDIYENITEEFLTKYKLNNIVKSYLKSNYNYIKFVYPDKEIYPWLFKLGARNYLSDDNEIKRAFQWLIEKEKLTVDDIYNGRVIRDDLVKNNKLNSIFYKRFQNSIINGFDWYYNNFTDIKFDKDKYTKNKPKYFYEKDYQINLIRHYFSELGFNEFEYSYENRRIIVENFNRETLFKLCGGTHIFRNLAKSIYLIFKKCYPNYPLYQWEMTVSNSYWQSISNRKKAIIELIEYEKVSFKDIPIFFNHDNLNNLGWNKFNGTCSKFYHSDYFLWINEVFPNSFNLQEFHNTMYIHDGNKMLSKKEVYLHDIFKSIVDDVLYVEKTNKEYYFYNEIESETYIPDWILNKNIIVEYFGWYNPKSSKNKLIDNYIQKADRKIEYYTSLDDFKCLFIYPYELQDIDTLINKIKLTTGGEIDG